jgi:hypothetical protein
MATNDPSWAAAAITFAHEAASTRAQDEYPVEQDQTVRRVDPARIYWINETAAAAWKEQTPCKTVDAIGMAAGVAAPIKRGMEELRETR